jgi:sensor histidine kinase YesM
LPDIRSNKSSLEREFQLAQHYLALMALRFGDRLEFHIDLPEELKAVQIAPMMLMTLVENAVQHGVEPTPGQVVVKLMAKQLDGKLHITIADSGTGLGQKILGTGVGLRNLRERLLAMYGNAAHLSLQRMDTDMTVAGLSLPLTDPQVTV